MQLTVSKVAVTIPIMLVDRERLLHNGIVVIAAAFFKTDIQ